MITLLTHSNKEQNENFNFVLLTDKSVSNISNKNFKTCLLVDKPTNPKGDFDFIGCVAKDLNNVNFWLNKKVDFLINPFDDKQRFFDYSTITVMKKNKIIPVILLKDFGKYNKMQAAYFLKNAIMFVEFCKKNEIPVIVDLGLDSNKRTNEKQELAIYNLFELTQEQGKIFNEMVFSDVNEKEN